MSRLQRQIKQLEHKIQLNDALIEQHYIWLQKKIPVDRLLGIAMASSFIYGFLRARNKPFMQTLAMLLTTGFNFNQLYKKMRRIIFYVKNSLSSAR